MPLDTLPKLLAKTDWRILRDFLSPSLFSVFPTRALTREAQRLLASASSRRGYLSATETRVRTLRDAQVGVRLAAQRPLNVMEDPARERGQAVLRVFFHQLYAEGPSLLDLRHSTFARDAAGDRVWVPGRPHTTWEPEFRAALHDLYGGFYDRDDPRFMRGLAAIGATPAEATFREQFGAEDPHAVSFDLERFVSTFHRAFEACRDAGSPLHRQLIPLGVYLSALYEHLAELGGHFDVEAAFHEARDRAGGR